MRSKIIFPVISIIQIFMGVGLLLGVFLDPVGLMQPFFNGEISADLIFFSQGIIDVTAMHMIVSYWNLQSFAILNKHSYVSLVVTTYTKLIT